MYGNKILNQLKRVNGRKTAKNIDIYDLNFITTEITGSYGFSFVNANKLNFFTVIP
jgi:hypothetical protein